MKSVEGTPKNESSGKVRTSTPVFVEIRPRTFTISTTWFGPTATCTSGGVSRIVNGPFVPKWSPSKPSTGTAASGGRGDGPAWTGRFRRSPAAARELTVGADVTCGSTGNVAWRGLSARDWVTVAKVDIAGAIASPTTTESARTSRHGWGDAKLAERWREPGLNPLPKLADGRNSLSQWNLGVVRRTRRRDARAGFEPRSEAPQASRMSKLPHSGAPVASRRRYNSYRSRDGTDSFSTSIARRKISSIRPLAYTSRSSPRSR